MYSCHLFLISSASVRSIPFLSFIEPIFAWNVPLVSLIFLKRSPVFPILLFPSVSLHWLLRMVFLSLLAILWNSEFKWVYLSFSPLPLASLIFSAICKPSSDNHFALLHFFFLGMVLISASCTVSRTSVHNSSGTLSIRSNPLNLFVTCWDPPVIQSQPSIPHTHRYSGESSASTGLSQPWILWQWGISCWKQSWV